MSIVGYVAFAIWAALYAEGSPVRETFVSPDGE